MKKVGIILGVTAVILLVAIQAVRPDRNNPSADPALALTAQRGIPEEVRGLLARSCYDCHSNQTRWPWYSEIAPVSWLVAKDVEEGRKHLNFSEWGGYTRRRQIAKLDEMALEVDKGGMPLPNYLLLHRDAVLSDGDKEVIIRWAEGMSDSLTELGAQPNGRGEQDR